MRIQSMFKDDINRKINGVVKVDQDESSVLVQELNEYVITRELKKHFITFFNNYIESFNETTADIGVWISGFFGSGKSHFLKMLSYLLENKEVQGVKTVERFRAKFADDPATFMLIDRATKGRTDTILFNIDIEGSINKDKTAVLRVFAKMFYNYLGFYGENLKVAKLEQFIAKKGFLKQPDDLKKDGIRLGVDKGTTQETTLRDGYPNARVIAYDDSPLALTALRSGAIQAFAQDGAKLGALLATLPNRSELEISPFVLTREYMGVGVPKGEAQLTASVDQILQGLEKDGTAARIYDRWFGPKSTAPLPRDFVIGSTK